MPCSGGGACCWRWRRAACLAEPACPLRSALNSDTSKKRKRKGTVAATLLIERAGRRRLMAATFAGLGGLLAASLAVGVDDGIAGDGAGGVARSHKAAGVDIAWALIVILSLMFVRKPPPPAAATGCLGRDGPRLPACRAG